MSAEQANSSPALLYFGDPMCSWCYGFAPVLRRVHEAYADLPVVCVLGGLRPGPRAQILEERLGRFLRQEWAKISEVTGQPFGLGILEREGFLYNTEPASRAVVIFRRSRPRDALFFFESLQNAFYKDSRDITDPVTLADLYAASEAGTAAEFMNAWTREDVRQETQADFQFSAHVGMTAFPSLVYARHGKGQLLCRGYAAFDELCARIDLLRGE